MSKYYSLYKTLLYICQETVLAGHIGNTSKSMTKEEFIDKFIARLNFVGTAPEQEIAKTASEANKKAQ